jgi:hypothetical protein
MYESQALGFLSLKNLFPLVSPTVRTDPVREFRLITLRTHGKDGGYQLLVGPTLIPP